MINEQIVRAILEDAVYAPSGDNFQPWRFVFDGNALRLYHVANRDIPFDFRRRGSYVAHGALLENIRICALQNGFEISYSLFPRGTENDCVAEMHFSPHEPFEDPLYPYIRERHTNRKPYKKISLTDAERSEILKSVKEIGGGRIVLIEDRNKMKKLGVAAAVNDAICLEVPTLHHYFFQNMVWSKKEELEKKSGLYLRTLELPPPIEWMFRIIRHPRVMNILNKFGFSRFAAKGNARIYGTGSALGAILVPSDTPQDFILAGRLLQRIWLHITKLGLKLQPVTGLLFLMQRIEAGERDWFSENQIERLRNAYDETKDICTVENDTLAMFFRMGEASGPSARSSRLPPVLEIIHA